MMLKLLSMARTATKKIPYGFGILGATVLVFGGTAAAVSEPQKVSYMQIYSAKGTYTRAMIEFAGSAAPAHKCAGTELDVGESKSVKLYPTRPHKIICDAVDGANNYYRITFLKGKKAATNGSDYKQIPASAPNRFMTVDIDFANSYPYKSCTVVKPDSGYTKYTTNCPAGSDSVPQDTSQLGIALKSSTNVKTVTGPTGNINLIDTGPWDGNNYISRSFCTGSVSVTYQRTDIGGQPVSQAYTKRLLYSPPTSAINYGHCVAKLTRDKAVFAKKATYTINVSYPGNTYFSAPANASTTFTTK